MKIGCYWGRFNPPHKGHISLVKKLLKKVDRLIIAIGSAQEAGTQRNPFNGKERALMWKGYLKENGIKQVRIIQVIDGKSWKGSVRNLLRLAKFDILFTDKESIIKASKGRFKVEKIKRVGELSSTQIRKAIASDKAWEHLTGKSVVQAIKRFGGQVRIKQIFKKC